MLLKQYYLELPLFASLIAILLTISGQHILPLALVVETPLVLFLPGFMVTEALFPNRELGLSERVVLSICTSIALTILGGVVLNLTPLGLTAFTWSALLGTIVLVAYFVAAVRQARVQARHPPRAAASGFTVRQYLLFGVALFLTGSAIVIARSGVEQQPTTAYTQLWLLPTTTSPTTINLQYGIANDENRPMTYSLTLLVDNQPIRTNNGLQVQAGASWNTTITLPKPRHAQRVVINLYRADQPTNVYRTVALTINP